VVYKNIPAAFTIDWIDGFLLKPFASPTYAFVYSFSQLKGSSDDGNATLTLQFQEKRKPGMKPNLITEQVQIRLSGGEKKPIYFLSNVSYNYCYATHLSFPTMAMFASLTTP
jgi:hypothetical protein